VWSSLVQETPWMEAAQEHMGEAVVLLGAYPGCV